MQGPIGVNISHIDDGHGLLPCLGMYQTTNQTLQWVKGLRFRFRCRV